MVDENPYKAPVVDESKWFTGGHLGGQIQQINWQVRLPCLHWKYGFRSRLQVSGLRCQKLGAGIMFQDKHQDDSELSGGMHQVSVEW